MAIDRPGAAPGEPVGGAPALREEFEGPEPSWQDSGGDAQYKISSHERVSGIAHSGRGCEQVRLVGNNGTYVYLSHDVSPGADHQRTVAERLDQGRSAGLQILARVVIPRTKDPATGQPLTMLVSGSGYTQVGSWQQLRLDNLPQQFERQLRVLRAQHGPGVDGHEALIDRVVLNVYGGPGTTTVLIDDLEVNGFVGATSGSAAPAEQEPDEQRLRRTTSRSRSNGAGREHAARGGASERDRADGRRSTLLSTLARVSRRAVGTRQIVGIQRHLDVDAAAAGAARRSGGRGPADRGAAAFVQRTRGACGGRSGRRNRQPIRRHLGVGLGKRFVDQGISRRTSAGRNWSDRPIRARGR